MFDFDRVIERRGTHASKWDNMKKLSGIDPSDGIPMWVADMDFAAPPGVTEALRAEVERGTHGYYADTGSWAAALVDWMARRHRLKIEPGWVSPTPGIVSGLGLILQAASEPGDEVVVFPPVYHAFRRIILANERRILDAQLVEANGRYAMDLDALQTRLSPRSKVVFFCNPHNPGGTMWTPDEIRELATFCAKNDLLLVSDEIHCDLILGAGRHIPTLSAAPGIADRLITCLAATKTFNLAGAHVGACVTSNPAIKRKLDQRILASGLASYNTF
jgi:cysteine-S-conjugate beta-lyase